MTITIAVTSAGESAKAVNEIPDYELFLLFFNASGVKWDSPFVTYNDTTRALNEIKTFFVCSQLFIY